MCNLFTARRMNRMADMAGSDVMEWSGEMMNELLNANSTLGCC